MSTSPKPPESLLVRRLFSEARPFWRQITLLLVVELIAAPIVLLSPVPLKIAVDSVLQSKPLPEILDLIIPSFMKSTPIEVLALAAVLQVLLVLLAQLQDLCANV